MVAPIATRSSAVSLDKTTIRLDVAQGGLGQGLAGTDGGSGGAASGGGVYLSATSVFSMIGGTLSRDEAVGGEGSPVSYAFPQSGELIPSGGTAAGGGIESRASDISLRGTMVSHDLAHGGDAADPTGSGFFYLAGDAYGGGIDFESVAGDLSLVRSKFLNNSASGGNAERPGSAYGGALSIASGQSVAISDSLLEGNSERTDSDTIRRSS